MNVTDGSVRGRQPWISELLPEPATPVTATSTPSGTSTDTSRRLWSRAFRIGIEPREARGSDFGSWRTSRWRPVAVPDADQAVDRALEHDRPAVGTGAGTHVDDVIGDTDDLRVVLDDEDRVALVAQALEQRIHPLDVVCVQPDRRLVEDVGDVGQCRSQVADHPGALRLAARQRAGRPVEAEVAQAHLDERVEALPECRQQRPDRRFVEAAHPLGQVADLHRARVGDADPLDLRRSSCLVEPGSAAVGARAERHGSFHEGADVRLERIDILGQERLLDLEDQAFVGEVDALHLDLGRLAVEEVVQLLRRVVADRLVGVEAGLLEDARRPAICGVTGDGDRALGERLALVVDLGQVDVARAAHALAARAHAAGDAEGATLGLARAAIDLDRPAARDRRDVEGERLGSADVRLADPAEHDPQHRARVRHRADGGTDVGAHPLLVEDDRGRQAFERIDVGPGQRRHEALHEGAVGLVDQPLRLRGDRLEHERALARAGHAGKHRQTPLRDVKVDIPKVVLAGAANFDCAPVGHRHGAQRTAFFTSSTIRFSAAGVSSMTANAIGNSSPSSILASGWNPNVE